MKCNYCEIKCEIREGKEGHCRMFTNVGDVILEKFPDMYLSIYPTTIETVPMMHYYPRNRFLVVSTIGCNFSCEGCVSGLITTNCDLVSKAMKCIPPEEMIQKVREENCTGVVFCLNEPTVAFPSFMRLAKAARAEGLTVGCSSNGYMTEETVSRLIPYLDFVNIGLKGYSDERYRECGVGSFEPVFRNIRMLHDAGVHLEVSMMYIKGREEELLKAAQFLGGLSPDIPLQVMRFMPFGSASDEMEPHVSEAERLCKEAGRYLNYVYLFNSIGTDLLNTHCPKCNATVISRGFNGPMGAKVESFLERGICTCGYQIPMKGTIANEAYSEPRFLGGYRITRGMESIHELFGVLGVTDNKTFQDIWPVVMNSNYMATYHERLENIPRYLETVEEFGNMTGTEKKAIRIINYLKDTINEVSSQVEKVPMPRVYYTMGHPFISMHASKLENKLVEIAGGFSLNNVINSGERQNSTISVEEINKLNPDIILFSGNMGFSVPEFYDFCHENKIDVDAVSNHRISRLEGSRWRFGSPMWFASLLDIANHIHPEIFNYNIGEEIEKFNISIK